MDKTEEALQLLRSRGVAWFSQFLSDGEYSLQCGKYYMLLDEGHPEAGEPPWVYASGDLTLHGRKLEDCPPEYPDSDCQDIYLDFIEDGTEYWTLKKDRFIDEVGVEYAVISSGSRLLDLPSALLEYDKGNNEPRQVPKLPITT